ncbi:beta/gamma crystallin-related protein [Streptomyces bugieae]|uniref:Beta/gamma crystallin-related protein n=1 Tax=Streptomyces bugieae TaxID=3098223 RepID=A0ABU7NFY6_9ACTN|nr:beta/gamma crystallin-related protein [Streptomyces sp. DSM 41528]
MRISHLAAGAVAAALALGSSLPAFADSSQEAGGPLKPREAKVKLYEQPNFKGRYGVITRSMANLRANGWDHSGSATNPGKRTVTFYQHTGYNGARFSLAPGEKEPHFGNHPHMSDGPGSLHFR